MKNPRTVLRATTALMVSLSFLGSHAVANEATLSQLSLAQNTLVLPEQAEGKAKGKEKKAEAALEETAEQAAESAEAAAEEAEEVAQSAAETAEEATLPLTEEEAAAETSAEAGVEAGATSEEAVAEQPVAEEAEAEAEAAAAAEAVVTEEAAEGDASAASTGSEGAAEEATAETTSTETTATETTATETTSTEAQPAAEAPAETTAEGEPLQMQSTAEGEAAAEEGAAETTATEAPAETTAGTTSTETTTEATAETPAAETSTEAAAETTAAGEASGETEVVEEVNEQEIEQATKKGDDVVVEEKTTAQELEAQMKEAAAVDVSKIEESEPVEVEEEVVTDETSRSSDEEVRTTAAASSSDDDDDDDNDIWKYLGAAAAGAAVGALVPALGGRLVQNQGDRMIVERDGEFYVRKDENALLRQPGVRVQTETFPDGLTRTTVIREDGSRVVTIRDQGGFVLRRTRILPDGTEYVLIDDSPQDIYSFTNWDDELPSLNVDIPQDRYVLDYSRASDDQLRQTLVAQPIADIDRTFSLRDVRENERVRALVPRIDLAINFDSGSAAIKQTEAQDLSELGQMMSDVIRQNPREIFLVEGHTDAVGSNLMNLALSDRRAEAVALALTEYYDIPPENLVVQGYGERFLKEQTEGPSQLNRRATVRRITPLIEQVASNN